MKKAYVKPEMTVVELRTEERLAGSCDYYDSRYSTPGCTDSQFQITNPSNCFRIDDYTVS